MSIKKIIVDLMPLYEHYEKFIDPHLGIVGSIAIKQDIIMNEVLVLMGGEHRPDMYTLRELLTENLVTDVRNSLLTAFQNLAFELLRGVNDGEAMAYSYTVRMLPSFSMEVAYHIPMTLVELETYMQRKDMPAQFQLNVKRIA